MKLFPAFCEIFVVFLCYLGDALAVRRFCKGYMKISSLGEKWFPFLLLFARMAIEIVYFVHPVSYLIYVMAEHVAFAVFIFILFQDALGKRILMVSFVLAVRTLLWYFCGSFLSALVLILHHIGKGEAVIQLWWEECIIFSLAYIVEIIVLTCLAFHRMSFMDEFSGRGSVIMAVPFFVFTIVTDIAGQAATKGILLRSGGNWGLYYDQLFSHTGNCILTALSMLAAGFYLVGTERVYLEQKKKERYHAGILAYQAMEGQYRQMERLRHDMKNHLLGMYGMLKDREWDKLEQYLNRMLEAGAVNAGEEATGCKALDALFFYKRKLAEEKNILWECDVELSRLCCVDSFDLCILFGNILDNAIEACEKLPDDKMRFITIKSKVVKKCFLLEVKNSTELETVEEVRVTHKENPEMHGIGIQNMEEVVRRYHGVLEMEIKEGVFSVSVLLPLIT